jgi:hypothetical protein
VIQLGDEEKGNVLLCGPPGFAFAGQPRRLSPREFTLRTLFFGHYFSDIILQTWALGVDPARLAAAAAWRR